jgi:hypothetical protein
MINGALPGIPEQMDSIVGSGGRQFAKFSGEIDRRTKLSAAKPPRFDIQSSRSSEFATPPSMGSCSRSDDDHRLAKTASVIATEVPKWHSASALRRACPERPSGFVLRTHVDSSNADWRLVFSYGGEIDRRQLLYLGIFLRNFS